MLSPEVRLSLLADVLTQRQRSYNMSQIKARHTKPEKLLKLALASRGLRYSSGSRLPGKPDLVVVNARLAVFVDGCFWHQCPKHMTWPATNGRFWKTKILSNVARDQKVRRLLRRNNWRVARVWEHSIRTDAVACARRLEQIIERLCAARHLPVPRRKSSAPLSISRRRRST